jgi:poly-gamma-glutamate capsule biosynthesis protein CapA/YwtB (metallophosphatase superfamily)
LTVAAGGDVQGDRNVGTFIDAHGGPAVLAKVKPYLETADIAFVNLEGPISDVGKKHAWKEYTFRSRLALTSGLASAGIDVVSLANNHAMDCGSSALLDTIARLDEAGINHAGGGADSNAARAPALLIAPAGTVAVFAFTDKHAAGFAAGAEKPGVATISDSKRLLAAVAEADKKVDFVIVSFHWGTEYTPSAAGYQRALAHKAIDAGADLILGHHPHVIQGLEVYRDKLIAYSLGDFVFDHYKRVTGEAFVLQVTMDRSGPPSATIVPVYLSDPYGIPAPVSGKAADVILDRLTRLSAAYGVKLTRSGDTAFWGAPAPAPPPGL